MSKIDEVRGKAAVQSIIGSEIGNKFTKSGNVRHVAVGKVSSATQSEIDKMVAFLKTLDGDYSFLGVEKGRELR